MEKQHPKEALIAEKALQLFLRHGYPKVTIGDIALAAKISRPSLYAAFENKERILDAILRDQADQNEMRLKQASRSVRKLQSRMELLFSIWIVEPVAAVFDQENARDLVNNCAVYAPAGVEALYERFEANLREILETGATRKPSGVSLKDSAHILSMAARGLKATTKDVAELKRLVAGLISITVAALE
ncbi:MAG: TetR/AcrR family transcriptional regulator [Proteobacteria bacterium]|nr:MAG: TetR/AcrR family transcriptional regulator [Pseudomonadota bacterium]